MMWVDGLRRDCWHREVHVLSAAEERTEPQGTFQLSAHVWVQMAQQGDIAGVSRGRKRVWWVELSEGEVPGEEGQPGARWGRCRQDAGHRAERFCGDEGVMQESWVGSSWCDGHRKTGRLACGGRSGLSGERDGRCWRAQCH